jgi:adenylate cyclase
VKAKLTLSQLFVASLLTLVAALAGLFAVVFVSTRATIIESSERMREGASRQVEERVRAHLAAAPAALDVVQREIEERLFPAEDLARPETRAEFERAFKALLVSQPEIDEVTLTYARMRGFEPDGEILLEDEPRGQISVTRPRNATEGGFAIETVSRQGEKFEAVWRTPGSTPVAVPDPTLHDTFTSAAARENYGRPLPSDLQYSPLDTDLPAPQRRIEVSVQRVLKDAGGNFIGVLRVGQIAHLEDAVKLQLAPPEEADPHRIFLCDSEGRLITRIGPQDRWREEESELRDLRVAPAGLPPEIAAALAQPGLREVDDDEPLVSGSVRVGSEEYLTTFRALKETQDWIVGIVVPRSYYLGRLASMRDRLLLIAVAIIGGIVLAGSVILRSVRRAHARIRRESLRMTQLEFSPASAEAPFRDVSEVLENLEKAKTAMRAMGKYVPVDLVRRLYRDRTEPVLGGEEQWVSVMFTDVQGFTTMAEKLPPAVLANALGRYLDVMAGIIQRETRGTIDKYIGDAIMAIWNAPEPVEDHAAMACRAALRCREAGRELSRSADWGRLPAFETRFGLHCGEALVGHFGAHDRMNYTAIGDAINLTARLESLNKQYGTTILASEQVHERTGGQFAFRLLDLVAVKGKSRPTRIYELLGVAETFTAPPEIANYEQALELYLRREFAEAAELLRGQMEDAPSAVLHARCLAYAEKPPAEDWGGVFAAMVK